ncbi:methylation-associated defense system restriction endonuclease subunit S MAD5 [Gemmatimonas sp. UBA7669]|uniref:methylation-associated defense system restriction endonuclease subunit S MAD5 n=1 Tax=Gemmatimonas sp. UBA7669 TaxID=1946568 RepID=UPI0025BAB9CB|nr:hypothetical protein [Gemmatimonas sp. UBA7669]
MKVKNIPSAWMHRDGRRFDCGPYMSGALEAKIRLEGLACRKDRLADLTTGRAAGIYNGPQFVRNFVNDPAHGVPFLGTSSMLRADLSDLPLLRKRDAQSAKLAHLRIDPGMTLISCSGTIGRMVYARPDMAGMWSNQDILKVVPDAEKVSAGYLYAFLSSKFGVPLVTSGTYGAIIQHIEPQHIADLPVPRLGDRAEGEAHRLVQKAATALSQHAELMRMATSQLLQAVGLTEIVDKEWQGDSSALGWRELGLSSESLRAFNYDPRARRIWDQITEARHSELGELCDSRLFKGKIIFKRIDAAPEFGLRLIGQRQAFQVRPEGRWISASSVDGLGLQVPAGSTLIPSHGTLGEQELYCRAVLVTKGTSRFAFSGDFFRCVPIRSRIEPGFLYAYMRSRLAFRLLRSISTGSKQQEQHVVMMRRFPIPRLGTEEESRIAAMVDQAGLLFDVAVESESAARALVERTIEEAA